MCERRVGRVWGRTTLERVVEGSITWWADEDWLCSSWGESSPFVTSAERGSQSIFKLFLLRWGETFWKDNYNVVAAFEFYSLNRFSYHLQRRVWQSVLAVKTSLEPRSRCIWKQSHRRSRGFLTGQHSDKCKQEWPLFILNTWFMILVYSILAAKVQFILCVCIYPDNLFRMNEFGEIYGKKKIFLYGKFIQLFCLFFLLKTIAESCWRSRDVVIHYKRTSFGRATVHSKYVLIYSRTLQGFHK